ncbi:MAG: sialate O-acetylesterase [Lentisphaeria bacterium]
MNRESIIRKTYARFGRGVMVAAFLMAVGLQSQLLAGELKCPQVFGSHMVLQRQIKVPIWGWAKPGGEVKVSFNGQTLATKADTDGAWRVSLDPMQASAKGQALTVSSGDETLTLDNVLIGEVWLASGQSNMAYGLRGEMLKSLPAPHIRMVRFANGKQCMAKVAQADVECQWGDLQKGSSAVASFFAMKLQKELKVPVGIISASWGGTRIQTWTPTKQTEAKKSRYNAMIHPFVGMAMRGAIWYQGESNVGAGLGYEKALQTLSSGWREIWGLGDFPFYFVQIAPFGRYSGEKLGRLWEGQMRASRSIMNCGMVVTTDVGDLKNIHPPRKKEVGERLALWALAKDYPSTTLSTGGKAADLVYSGPLYKGFEVKGNKMIISFDYAEGGLACKGEKLTDIYVKGEGETEFVPASVAIDGGTLVVSHPEGKMPVAVRMGWNKNAQPNLMNKAGLMASPFRTDSDKNN